MTLLDAALSDIRVIDLSQGIAGGYCTKLLADCGADVIKIEPPVVGGRLRALGPFPAGIPDRETSGLHLYLDTNKRSITVDITTRSGQAVLRRLLAKADVVVESELPGKLAACGLDFDEVRETFPYLIYCSITGFGRTGPYHTYQANSFIAAALAGLMQVPGGPGHEPFSLADEGAEYLAGIQAWLGILAALALRAREGGGDHLDVALVDALIAASAYPGYQRSAGDFLSDTAQDAVGPSQAVSPVDAKALFEDSLVGDSGLLVEIAYPGGVVRFPRAPFHFSETPLRERAAPRLGADTPRVLGEAGYDGDSLRILHERGVI